MPIVEDEALAIGKKIRQLRERAALSQDKLAYNARVSSSTVQEIEMGRREPHGLTLQKIATALDITVEELRKAAHRNAMDGNGVHPKADDDKLSSNGDGSKPTTIDQIDHLLIGESEILKWVAQTARIALMMNRREAMYTLMGTVLAGLGLPGGNVAAEQNGALQSIQYGLNGGKVGSEVAVWAHEQVMQLKRLDTRIGGKQLYFIAQSNLVLLQNLLQMRAASGEDERELRLALAQTASQAGWFAEDAMLFDQAAQNYHFSVEMAKSAGNNDLAVYCLARLATIDLAKGYPHRCLSRLEMAESQAGKASPWRDFILTFAVEAHSHLRDEKTAGKILAQADSLYQKRIAERMQEWTWSRRRPSLRADAIRAFLPTNPRFAIELSEDALTEIPANFQQSRLHVMASLARAKLAIGERDEALKIGSQVLDATLEIPTPWVEKHLIEFHAKLPDDPVAKKFKERFTDYARMRKPGTLHS